MAKERTGILVILDGFGISTSEHLNAVDRAKKPTYESALKLYSHTELGASGKYVGLPRGVSGNSEVGHLNIGAGRVVQEDFSLVSRSIQEGSFFENATLKDLFQSLKQKKKKSSLHLIGLLSDDEGRDYGEHIIALLEMAKRQDFKRVFIHLFIQGRKCSKTSAAERIARLGQYCKELGVGKIVSVMGGVYGIDREGQWELTQEAYLAIIAGKSSYRFGDPVDHLNENYRSNVTDDFIRPALARSFKGVRDADAVVMFNCRLQGLEQIVRAITQTDFPHFRRENFPTLSRFITMNSFDSSFQFPVVCEKQKIVNSLGEMVSKQGWKQLRIAEAEKYQHVTYYFNGGDERVFEKEKRILVPSPQEIDAYDTKPEMGAQEVTETLLSELNSGSYRFAVVNYANADMVGHTGNFRAAVKAVEVVDRCLGHVLRWVESNHGFAIVTADHGNCERMLDGDGMPLTSHTEMPVPFIVIDATRRSLGLRAGGKLCDIAPTFLELWGVSVPEEMSGSALIDTVQ